MDCLKSKRFFKIKLIFFKFLIFFISLYLIHFPQINKVLSSLVEEF